MITAKYMNPSNGAVAVLATENTEDVVHIPFVSFADALQSFSPFAHEEHIAPLVQELWA